MQSNTNKQKLTQSGVELNKFLPSDLINDMNISSEQDQPIKTYVINDVPENESPEVS